MSGVETTKQRPAQNVNQHTVTTNRPQALRDESLWAAAEALRVSNSHEIFKFLPKLAQKSIVSGIHPD